MVVSKGDQNYDFYKGHLLIIIAFIIAVMAPGQFGGIVKGWSNNQDQFS